MENTNMTPESENKKSLSHKAGDKLERLGEKLNEKGMHKLGNIVSDAGDKLEHMNDDKDESMTFDKQ